LLEPYLEMDPYSTSNDWQERLVVGFEEGAVRVEYPAPMVTQRSERWKSCTTAATK
jgi:hypothetical protein